MIRRVLKGFVTAAAAGGLLVVLAGAAAADHTDPDEPLSQPTSAPAGQPGIAGGEGEWHHIFHMPPNPGSDHHYFRKGGRLYLAHGTLGQGNVNHVGQRIVQLMNQNGEVDIEWVADHGSANCTPGDPAGTTGLQHDQSTTPPDDPELLFDSTDALGRCHDPDGGGIEIIDISGLPDPTGVREVHLVRFNGTTHTLTRNDNWPWLIHSNSSDQSGRNWIDIMDIRSCLSEAAGGTLPEGADLDTKRDECRPVTYRIPFEDEWTQGTATLDGDPSGTPMGCHDVTSVGTTLYCSGIHGEVILDISGMVDDQGEVQGDPLPCTVVDGTDTDAMVSDCRVRDEDGDQTDKEAWEAIGAPQAEGWEYVGHYNHVGRTPAPITGAYTIHTNLQVPATQGVAISHQTEPLHELPPELGRFMAVSDERGGGVLPHGASCQDEDTDLFWHGGVHFFDISDPSNPQYATMLDDDGEEVRAVWRGEVMVPRPTFCVVHMFHQLHDEQRLIFAYYSQGTKFLDYRVTADGHLEFDEVASWMFTEPGIPSNSWTSNVFHTVDNDDGSRTYWITVSDIDRGLDVLTWTGPPGEIQDAVPSPLDRVERVFGPTRIETAVAISQSRWDTSPTVVLSRDDVFADALAGAPLAADEDAPILLTHRDQLPAATQEEIGRLGARRVILLGGEAAISEDVADELRQQLIIVERIGGEDRFETAAMIAERLGDTETAFLVEGWHANPERGWPDAVSAAPYAAFTGNPVLLTIHDTLPEATADALEDLGVSETIVVGGSGAVSEAVVTDVGERGHGPRRVFGADRYATSVAVLEESLDAGMDTEVTWLATGLNWPDALAAGPVVGLEGNALLLVHGEDLDVSPASRNAFTEHAATMHLARLLGGTMAISAGVEQQVGQILTEHPVVDDDHEDDDEDGEGSSHAVLVPLALLPFAALARRRR